jgi:S-DNA-T family DNA segregation ATPase FtsK/SpoIIIE
MPLWLRLILLFPALLCSATALAPLPALQSWPLAVSLGGSLGDAILNLFAGVLSDFLGWAGRWVAWLVFAAAAIALLSATFGVAWRDWRRGFAAIAAAFVWIGAFAGRLRRGEPPAAVEPRIKPPPVKRLDPAPEPRAAAPAPAGKEKRPPKISAGPRKAEPVDPRQTALSLAEPSDYILPPHELLQLPETNQRSPELTQELLRRNAEMLSGVLADFGVKGEIVNIRPGPVVTLYELEPAPGTKSSRVIGLADDIARSMSAVAVRVAVVRGSNVIGVELPNQRRETVYMRETLSADAYQSGKAKLALILGKDIGGNPVIADLAGMPHLLVAGTTGSGKSVAINTMILSLLYRMPPERCRFIMIDPKMLELSVYDGIPHLLTPVVTQPKKAVVALKWTVREMEDRYNAMSKLGVRNVEGFNQRLREARANGEMLTRKVQTGFDADTGKPVFEDQLIDLKELPYIVVVVDEFADLMLVAGKDIEGAIQRLAQMAGIHLIMATQRPSVDVITGTIKANFPTRISFQVTSKIDSRTILGEAGAEQLLGMGDMLYMAAGGRVTRVHGPFVRDQEVEKVVAYLKTQGEPDYIDSVTEDDGFEDQPGSAGEESASAAGGDDLYDQAVALVSREGKASTSFIQRHLRIGYNSAARLIERMEKEGVISQANHANKREVLVGNHAE